MMGRRKLGGKCAKRMTSYLFALLAYIFALLLMVTGLHFLEGCGGRGGSLPGSPFSGSVVPSFSQGGGSLMGIFRAEVDLQNQSISFAPETNLAHRSINGKIYPLTQFESNITFHGGAAWAPATKILSGNVYFDHTNTFNLYEAQEIFIFWSDSAAGLNSTSGGFFAPITIGGTTYSNPPNGGILQGDALPSPSTSPTKLWKFDNPNGVNFFTRFGLYVYRWLLQTSGTTNELNSVYIRPGTSGKGWAVGGAGSTGTVLRTTNYGVTWSASSVGTNPFNDVDGSDDNTGWMVGDGGTIYAITGGTTFTSQTSGTTGKLTGVDAFDSNTVYAVGVKVLKKTTNGGTTWGNVATTVPGGCTIDPGTGAIDCLVGTLKITFPVDSQTGWIAGGKGAGGGLIWKTTDGGATWVDQTPAGASNKLTNIFFLNNSNGWVVGQNDIFRTTDGGTSWSSASVTGSPLQGVWFRDASEGWVVGGGSNVRKSTDGGATWSAIQQNPLDSPTSPTIPPTAVNWNEVTFASDSDGNKLGYVVGAGGKIALYK